MTRSVNFIAATMILMIIASCQPVFQFSLDENESDQVSHNLWHAQMAHARCHLKQYNLNHCLFQLSDRSNSIMTEMTDLNQSNYFDQYFYYSQSQAISGLEKYLKNYRYDCAGIYDMRSNFPREETIVKCHNRKQFILKIREDNIIEVHPYQEVLEAS